MSGSHHMLSDGFVVLVFPSLGLVWATGKMTGT